MGSNHINHIGSLRKLRKPSIPSITSTDTVKILLCLLLFAEVVDVGQHFLQAVDPLLRLLL